MDYPNYFPSTIPYSTLPAKDLELGMMVDLQGHHSIESHREAYQHSLSQFFTVDSIGRTTQSRSRLLEGAFVDVFFEEKFGPRDAQRPLAIRFFREEVLWIPDQ